MLGGELDAEGTGDQAETPGCNEPLDRWEESAQGPGWVPGRSLWDEEEPTEHLLGNVLRIKVVGGRERAKIAQRRC